MPRIFPFASSVPPPRFWCGFYKFTFHHQLICFEFILKIECTLFLHVDSSHCLWDFSFLTKKTYCSWDSQGKRTPFILGGSKITADDDCSHAIKRCLFLEGKVMTNLDSILKSRDMTLPTKVCLVKPTVFPLVMYGCESWTIKKAEWQRIDAFELWCWRRLLRVPWTPRRSNQFILKEISSGCSLEGLMLKLKLQYFSHLMWRTDSLENTLMLGKIEGRRRRGR